MPSREEHAVVADPELGNGGSKTGLTVVRPRAGLSVIEVRCELDALTAPSLRQLLGHELDSDCRALIVDMSGCEFLGSSGLAALVEGKQRADSASVSIVLAGPTRIASRALKATGLEPMFQIYPSTADAAAALVG
jgi:anti-sigma B factor antagonist